MMETVIGLFRNFWVALILAAFALSYSLYVVFRNYSRVNEFQNKKKELQKELADLEVKYSEGAARLEARIKALKEKLKHKDNFINRG
jgi:uncharacterized protein HemX